ncbi:hypothetical protein Sru01_53730 [Sphaerisporangium rufum]|uniref:Uncharacterized protein n=1 Tax=Sphaerisporangium rufum TaxID=1381558 RepID=A0A919R643_9ACTN|nr:hypothetical protein [Sphaerisporangium rufum]GII80391.1 hypothetical protein Sru01_53730 [Sphaerisporangium rufum]
MRDVTQIVAQVREELAGELRERVRRRLGEQPAEWLADQLTSLALGGGEVAGPAVPRQVRRSPGDGSEAAGTAER